VALACLALLVFLVLLGCFFVLLLRLFFLLPLAAGAELFSFGFSAAFTASTTGVFSSSAARTARDLISAGAAAVAAAGFLLFFELLRLEQSMIY
jgi:hypothetical protein